MLPRRRPTKERWPLRLRLEAAPRAAMVPLPQYARQAMGSLPLMAAWASPYLPRQTHHPPRRRRLVGGLCSPASSAPPSLQSGVCPQVASWAGACAAAAGAEAAIGAGTLLSVGATEAASRPCTRCRRRDRFPPHRCHQRGHHHHRPEPLASTQPPERLQLASRLSPPAWY